MPPASTELEQAISIGTAYTLFFGNTSMYSHQYSVSVKGDIFADIAQQALDALKDQWLVNLGKSKKKPLVIIIHR
jgi:hypothetical protein